ncbi:putative cytochrome P450 monooxygenase [Xylaria nigripes]|nr:putative cytochrome P450 monooxygenase [Xylaria nigripes]
MMGAVELARIGLLLCVVYALWRAIYNVFLHPLRKYPGPLSHCISVLPRTLSHVNGHLAFDVHELHKRYGPVVRVAPDELAFSSAQAWRDIYGHKKAGEVELPKYQGFYNVFTHVPLSIINSGREEHSMLRRQLAHGFSDRSMHQQEPIIGSYVNLLVTRLRTAVKQSRRQNLREWYNWTTFDVIGDLSFGVDGGFGCLQKADNHPWVKVVNHSIGQSSRIQALGRLNLHKPLVWLSELGWTAESKHQAIVYDKVQQRIESAQRPDFLESLISKKDELGLSHGCLAVNAAILILAGSETTATLLSGATYLLTMNPEILQKVTQEVRSTFKSDDEITLLSVSRLTYMLACLNESLRCYPPVTTGLPRHVPQGGTMIDGNFVPQGTIVSVFQWAVNHDENLWTEPGKFAPERWLNDPKYKNDQLDAMQPFSVGPRNCIGRNLAYAEMRLILAKIVYNFDITIADESRRWLHNQRAYSVWDKPDLFIHLTPTGKGERDTTARPIISTSIERSAHVGDTS